MAGGRLAFFDTSVWKMRSVPRPWTSAGGGGKPELRSCFIGSRPCGPRCQRACAGGRLPAGESPAQIKEQNPRANRPARRSASRLAQGKEGTRAPNDRHPSYKSGSLSAPACGGSPCRGCGHIVSAPLVPPCGVQRRAYASGPLAAALHEETMRSAAARRASVQCVATPAQPRVHGPNICGELHRAAGG